VRSRLRRKQSRPRSRSTTKKPPPGADDLCIRVSLTVAERRELRIAAAKADVSVGVLVRRLAMAALRRSADEQGGLNQTTDGAGALNVHAALTIADHRRDRAATPGSPHCASFDAHIVCAKRG
jgi:hypothetical protein